MATIINTPGTTQESSGAGMILGILLVAILAIAFFVYGLPQLRGRTPAANNPGINLDVNLPNTPSPQPAP